MHMVYYYSYIIYDYYNIICIHIFNLVYYT